MPIKTCQLCAIDFTVKHFLTALIDGMNEKGWATTAVCSDGPYVPDLRIAGYAVETISISRGMNPLTHLVSLVRLFAFFRRQRFDLLHVHTPIAALLGRIAGKMAGIQFIVYTAHGFYFHDQMGPLSKFAFVCLERIGGKLTDLLFTQSAEDAASAVLLGLLPAGRVIAIGNGVNPLAFRPGDSTVRARVRAELGIPAGAVAIGMVGRMVSEKGYGEFFAAAERIASLRSNVYFVAVGDRLPSDHAGSVDRALAAASNLLGERLILTGLRSDIPDLLAALDIFTLPSYREGMPRTIIEAMMMALPVVATDIRGSREEVVAGETGFLVPARDEAQLAKALLKLVDAPDMREQMGKAGRARALEHYVERTVVAKQIAAIRAQLPPGMRERA